jgi:ubiquitin-like protein Nedd8
MCRNDYEKTLESQNKAFVVLLPAFGDYRYKPGNLIDECGMCRKQPDRCILVEKIKWMESEDDIDKRIRGWNLFPLFELIAKQRILQPTMVRRLMMEYRRFISAKVHTQDFDATMLSPCPLVDIVWHQHILMTRDYISFCKSICKELIHHDPYGEFQKSSKTKRYRKTIDYFLNNNYHTGGRYDKLPKDLWFSEESRVHFESSNCKKQFQLFVQAINGNTKTLNVCPDVKIWQLKLMLQYKTGTSMNDIRLIYSGKDLYDDETVSSYNIAPESTMHMVLKIRGC